jgi:hypothetical protein
MICFWFIRHPRDGVNRSHRKVCGGFYVNAQGAHARDICPCAVDSKRGRAKFSANDRDSSAPIARAKKNRKESVG